MDAQQIRQAYFDFCVQQGHKLIPRARLVPDNDPTTLFTGSGMQPLLPYLLGEIHPDGKRLADSQTSLRAEDIDEVGDNRHTTFFEMLGNWSLGDYFKAEQLPWFWQFLTEVVGLDPTRLAITCFIGDESIGIPKDDESARIWLEIFKAKGIEAKTADIGSNDVGYERGMKPNERIFFYGAEQNWWSRAGEPANMPVGEPGGPDSEVFYDFQTEHDPQFGKNCHPNCQCGRFLEIGNSVFMEYIKTESGFAPLPQKNVDFGGGLERIAAAKNNDPDVFKISLLWPIIDKLQELTGKNYEDHVAAKRIIADHLRAAVWLGVDGVVPSNKTQGYVLRRLLRRAIVKAHELGIEQNFVEQVAPAVVEIYKNDFLEVSERANEVIETLSKEEKLFRQTLQSGKRMLERLGKSAQVLTGIDLFRLYDTYGYPKELALEEAERLGVTTHGPDNLETVFNQEMNKQRERSRTASKGQFKGGLADHSDITTKYHTATHLLYKSLRNVLGDHVIQRGSNITAERTRFDFSHPEKMTPEQIKQVEDMVNEQIAKDWPVSWREEKTADVQGKVLGAFGDRYGETVKVYSVGDPDGDNFSREICGGPHVEHTGQLAEEGKHFKIIKEESSSAGVRRIKAVLN